MSEGTEKQAYFRHKALTKRRMVFYKILKFAHLINDVMTDSGKYYRHFKGGKYKLLYIAKDSEDPSRELVVYQALYGEHGVWVRPKDMFYSSVERGAYSGPRFVEISEDEALSE